MSEKLTDKGLFITISSILPDNFKPTSRTRTRTIQIKMVPCNYRILMLKPIQCRIKSARINVLKRGE